MKTISSVIIILVISFLLLAACSGEAQVETDKTVIEIDKIVIETDKTEHFLLGNIWVFDSISELSSAATDIIRAEVLDSRTELINVYLSADIRPDIKIHTVYRLLVLETYEGKSKAGEIVEVMHLGGQLDDRELIEDVNRLPFSVGDDLIFFLRNFESYNFGNLPMGVLSPYQTAYRVGFASERTDKFTDGIEVALSKNPQFIHETFYGYDLRNHLVLTVGDLARIANIDFDISSFDPTLDLDIDSDDSEEADDIDSNDSEEADDIDSNDSEEADTDYTNEI
jgi:hypothetical protein